MALCCREGANGVGDEACDGLFARDAVDARPVDGIFYASGGWVCASGFFCASGRLVGFRIQEFIHIDGLVPEAGSEQHEELFLGMGEHDISFRFYLPNLTKRIRLLKIFCGGSLY